MRTVSGTLLSVVIPARNEGLYIAACIESVRAQVVPLPVEILVVDGRSSDDTAERARAAGAVVVTNEQTNTPAALNVGLAAARGDVFVRFDAHAEMPAGYLAACLSALREEERAMNVGGWRSVVPDGPWGAAIGAALASKVGVGNAIIWRRPSDAASRRDIDTVPLGCWWTEDLRRLGGWDERLLRNQDFELNHRIRETGGRVVFDPAIWSLYRPRESLRSLGRQYWQYGRFKAIVLSRAPRSLRPRQLAPVALLAVVALSAAPTAAAPRARFLLAAYVAMLGAVAAVSRGGWRTVPVLATIHLSWGAGLVYSAAQLARSSLSRAQRIRR